MLTVYDWCFCKEHGLEFCFHCPFDFRAVNNVRIEDLVEQTTEIDEDIKWEILEELDDRPGLALARFQPFNDKVVGDEIECSKHTGIECSNCINFSKVYIEDMGFWPEKTESSLGSDTASVEHALGVYTITDQTLVPPLLRPLGDGRMQAKGKTTSIPPSDMPFNHDRPQLYTIFEPHRFVAPSSQTRPWDIFKPGPSRGVPGFERLFHRDDDQAMLVYTDGACLDHANPSKRRAGWGLVYNQRDPRVSQALEGTVGGVEQTNNRAELRAVIGFLQLRIWEASGPYRFVVATDSEYVVEGVCDPNRLAKWARNGWKTSAGKPLANVDLWKALKQELESCEWAGLRVLFWRIPREWNKRADALAKKGADSSSRTGEARPILGIMM